MKTQTLRLVGVALVLLLAGACTASPIVQNTAPAPTVTGAPIPTLAPALTWTPMPTPNPTVFPSGITIRMSAGNKCTLEGPNSIQADYSRIQWIVDSKEHDRYGLAIVTLDPGKTIEDLRATGLNQLDPPDFAQWTGEFFELRPGQSQEVVIRVPRGRGPIYFDCFFQTPQTHFGDVGPVEVKE